MLTLAAVGWTRSPYHGMGAKTVSRTALPRGMMFDHRSPADSTSDKQA